MNYVCNGLAVCLGLAALALLSGAGSGKGTFNYVRHLGVLWCTNGRGMDAFQYFRSLLSRLPEDLMCCKCEVFTWNESK